MSSRYMTFGQLGDYLQEQWKTGNLRDAEGIHRLIESGILPVKLIREQLNAVIQREGEGLRVTTL